METVKEWLIDIAICVILAVVTAGMEARHKLEAACERRAEAVTEAK